MVRPLSSAPRLVRHKRIVVVAVLSSVAVFVCLAVSSTARRRHRVHAVHLSQRRTTPYDAALVHPEADVPSSSQPLVNSTATSWLAATSDSSTIVTALPVFPQHPRVPTFAPQPHELFFGIATTADRATHISVIWPHWLTPTPADPRPPACLILLPKTDFDPIDAPNNATTTKAALLRDLLQRRGIGHCRIETTHEPHTERYELRYLALLKEMKRAASKPQDIRWWIVGDDDTIWVDLRTLRRELGLYDPNKKWFLGGTSEAEKQVEWLGTMAFGGAGLIMSHAQYEAMNSLADWCIESLQDIFGGDGMYTRCAASAMGNDTKWDKVMTFVAGLHQVDVPGDATGFFQYGLPWISLHHLWHGWANMFPSEHRTPGIEDTGDKYINQIVLVGQVSKFLGGDNLFRRYLFDDGRQLLTLGYSITVFDQPLTQSDLSLIEHTWDYGDEYHLAWPQRKQMNEIQFDRGQPSRTRANMAQLKEKVGQRFKNTYYINEIFKGEDGSTILRHVDRWNRIIDLKWIDDDE